MSIKIIGVGDLTVDVFMPEIVRIPEWGQEVEISKPHRRLGGNIGNMAVSAAALNQEFSCFSCVGEDQEADFIISQLRELKLPTRSVFKIKGGNTSQTFAGLRKDGERFFMTYQGVTSKLEQIVLENPIPDGEVVFLSGWCLPPRIRKDILIEKITEWQEQGKWVVADMIWSDNTWVIFDDLLEVLRTLDAVFLNEDELKALTKTNDIDSGVKSLNNMIGETKHQLRIIKLGSRGACSTYDDKVYKYSPEPVDLKNTVGAGDMFNLAYIYAKRALNLDYQESLQFACEFVPCFIQSEFAHKPYENVIMENMKK